MNFFFYGLELTRVESKASYLYSKCCTACKQTYKMVAVIFVPKHLVIFIVMYRTNTGHRASSLYNETNTWNKFTFKC